MMLLATSGSTSLQEIGNKIISVGMPILIGIAITIGIVMVAYYGMLKFAKNAEQRRETIARVTWVGVCLGIVILASAIVLGLKDINFRHCVKEALKNGDKQKRVKKPFRCWQVRQDKANII